MKTPIEILNEIAKPYSCDTFLKFLQEYAVDGMYTHVTMIREIRNAMIVYAQQAIEEDRKIVAGNAKIQYEKDDRHPSHWLESIDRDSIINAPKQDLK